MITGYFEPTQESGAALFRRGIADEVVMLNLLRFREVADYAATPELAPAEPISGRQTYQKYIDTAALADSRLLPLEEYREGTIL